MKRQLSFHDRLDGAIYGMFIGDALAMPVHWYYDTEALCRDYGQVHDYLAPKNPHPDSILWRSSYTPPNSKADILHDQAQYWGRRGIHYHQFLDAGENTLNLKLAHELFDFLQQEPEYSAEKWLNRLIDFLITPGTHNDTYVEEYLRHFFINYGHGVHPLACCRTDEHHIGGLSQMLPVLLHYADEPERACPAALDHLKLTHRGSIMETGAEITANILIGTLKGEPLPEAIHRSCSKSASGIARHNYKHLLDFPDDTVIRRHFSSACYMDQSLPATIYLALKYSEDPEQGLIANTMAGGDNVGRGTVLGAFLGAAKGMEGFPERWISGLKTKPTLSHH
ncbi:ADP-ribosylglycohydrolase family protein [Desulfosediminicola sp.]|uniref:ADP-ribosylglycohydrolase family protein n=1 Tax=Desulfosediminicola sp. TaxID=2886825 RepID=UPI003AF21C63